MHFNQPRQQLRKKISIHAANNYLCTLIFFVPMNRNTSIAILKGIAIILMVVGHAEAPELLTNFIYTFHMPLFFMAAGYFFDRKYLSQPALFVGKRLRGLYIPFLKWSILFLLLHNVWHHFGILNESFGNWTGGVTHPYTLRSAAQRLMLIVTSMSGYDEFMAGAFWFFRGLLVASILFLLIYKAIDSTGKFSPNGAVITICLAAIGFTAWHIYCGAKLPIPNGGWRETWGIFFFGTGVLFRQYQHRIVQHWALCSVYFLLLCGAAWLHLSGMNNRGLWRDLWSLPLTGTIGFLMVYYIASAIDRRDSRLRSLLVFIGNNTMCIFVWHILSFKAVSLIKIWHYGLEWEQIGCHMVIHHNNHGDLYWALYSIAGTALPLLVTVAWRRFTPGVTSYISALRQGRLFPPFAR